MSQFRGTGRWAEMKYAGSKPPSIEQKAQGGEGCAEEPQDQALSLQLNAQLLQHQLKGCSCFLTPCLPPSAPGHRS